MSRLIKTGGEVLRDMAKDGFPINTPNKVYKYKEVAKDARLAVLRLIYKAQTSHIGSNFSAIDIMTVLFDKADPEKDEVILSAGWKAAAWYYFLWKKGIITEEELNSFCQPGSPFIGLVEPMNLWGLKFAGGSMGYGLPFGVGVALSKKMKGEEGNVYVLVSDGELQIGTTWESALIAAHHQLNNLIVIVDNNGLQAMGSVKDILNVGARDRESFGPWISQKFENFGWEVYKMASGHDYTGLDFFFNNEAIAGIRVGQKRKPQQFPRILIADTIKGKGVSFMQNNNSYHYKNLSKEEYEKAKKEIYAC